MRGMNANNGRVLSGIDHLKQSIRDILTTPLGSRVMRRNYGSRLFELLDNPSSASLMTDMIAATAEALGKWEHRISVKKVIINMKTSSNVSIDLIAVYKPNGQAITLDGIEIK